jgi:hypothetical protein
MNRDNDAYQPPTRRRDRGRPLTFAAVAVAAAAIGIAAAVIFLKNPVVSPAGYTPAAGSSSSAGNGNGGIGSAPSSGSQGGGGLGALPPLSGGGGGGALQLMLTGKVLAISGTSITLGGNGPSVTAAINGSTKFSGSVTSASGIRVGDLVGAEVSGQDSADMVAAEIQDPGQAP